MFPPGTCYAVRLSLDGENYNITVGAVLEVRGSFIAKCGLMSGEVFWLVITKRRCDTVKEQWGFSMGGTSMHANMIDFLITFLLEVELAR